MHKYAAATALAIALNITTLTPAVSGPPGWMPRHEVDCDSSARGLLAYAIRCHCSFECHRQYPPYTVRLPCSPGAGLNMPGYVSGMKGLCDVLVSPLETRGACFRTCVKAKKGTYP
jgi:hypothetical protein